MHGLEVPDALPGLRVDAHDALAVHVVAVAVAAVVVARRCRCGEVDVAEFVVGGERRPHVRVAHPLPGVVFPGLGEVVALLGDRVEAPLLLAGAHVVGAHVARRNARLLRRHVEDPRADDVGVADRDPGRAGADVAQPEPGASEVVERHVDEALLAEVGIGLPGLEVDRDQQLAGGGEEDALLLAVGPVLDSPRIRVRGSRRLVRLGVEHPELFAGRGVERRELPQRGHHVDPAADHERRAGEGARLVPHAVVGGLPAPGHLELREVLAVDVRQRRVAAEGVVAAVMRPLDVGGAGLAEGDGRQRRGRQCCQERVAP